MAKRASKGATRKTPARLKSSSRSRSSSRARSSSRQASSTSAADALFKLLQSPLARELLAVGATAAVAALAEHRYGKGTGAGARRALKGAVTAAAAAMGRRIASEFDDIKQTAKSGASRAA